MRFSRAPATLAAVASLASLVAQASCDRATAPASPVSPTSSAGPRAPASVDAARADAPLRDASDAAPTTEPAVDVPAIAVPLVHRLLFLGGADAAVPACSEGSRVDQVHCLLAVRYASDPVAVKIATELFDRTGDIAGVLPSETMEGGFRGTLHLVPEVPTGRRRVHLERVAGAAADFDDFFQRLSPGAEAGPPAQPGTRSGPSYRWRALGFRFMRSVGRTTPSAYAEGWSVAYNVDGSLNHTDGAVRELLFHEVFHLNDAAHGDWSTHALRALFDGIVARCHARSACLAPYAPTKTMVRGGTYYAFQPDNGDAVREYAAELALRYYLEERAILHGEPPGPRFKCGPPENARAWGLLVAEFFAGIDRTAACP